MGTLVRFKLLPANPYDTVGVPPVIEGVEFGGLLADKAVDYNGLIDTLNERGAMICISQRPQRVKPRDIDTEVYKWRHLIENFFAKIKESKTIARRADKTDTTFDSMSYPCPAGRNLPCIQTCPRFSGCLAKT